MSFQAIAKCIEIDKIKPINKLVLIMLANYSNESYQSYPSKQKLSQLCNCDERTISRALTELEELGIIHCKKRFKDGKQITNLYTLKIRGDKNVGGDKLEGAKLSKVGVTKMYPNTINKDTINIYMPKPSQKNSYPEEFELFWKEYPEENHKWNKKLTFLQWKKVKDKNLILVCVRNYKIMQKGFYYNPVKWIRDEHYLNYEIVKEKKVSKNTLAG